MHKLSDRLGSVIKSARLEKHLTQRQLAERLSITSYYLMSIENKGKLPSCDLLFRIIRELEISADAIFYPEHRNESVSIKKLKILINKCEEQDVAVIIGIIQSLLKSKEMTGGE